MSLTPPSREYSIQVGGENRKIIMSYGLFNDIMRWVPSADQIAELLVTDANLRNVIIRRLLTDKKKIETIDDLIPTDEIDVDIFELDELVGWVAEHVLHFFTKAAMRAAKIGTQYQGTIDELRTAAAAIQSNHSQAGAEI